MPIEYARNRWAGTKSSEHFMKKKVSRQREWQKKMKKRDRCVTCGKPLDGPFEGYCTEHGLANRLRVRKRAKSKAWRIGGPGRKPFIAIPWNKKQRFGFAKENS